jgi:hypothetical protein
LDAGFLSAARRKIRLMIRKIVPDAEPRDFAESDPDLC